MGHYGLEDWVDFLRGVVSHDLHADMARHLESGCKACSSSLALCHDLGNFITEDLVESPSDKALKVVRAGFAAAGLQMGKPKKPKLADLIFDGALEPIPVGFRSSGALTRQMLFRLQIFEIDLRTEPVAGSDRTVVTGQVLDRSKSRSGLEEMPILLSSSGQIVGWTLTNKFGEFQFECSSKREIKIMVGLEQDDSILLPVGTLTGLEKPESPVGPVKS